MRHRLLLTLGLLTILFSTPGVSFAAACSTGNLSEPTANAVVCFTETISIWVRVIGYSMAVIMIVYAGILYFNPGSKIDPSKKSDSSPGNAAKAKGIIQAVVIGLTIIILSEVIIRTTLGFVTSPNNQQGITNVLHNPTITP